MAESLTDLLAAGLSAILGQRVGISDKVQAGKGVASIDDVFNMTYVPILPQAPHKVTNLGELFEIYVKRLMDGSRKSLEVAESSTIAEIKAEVNKKRIPATCQILVYCGEELNDRDTIKSAGIIPGSTIYQFIRTTSKHGFAEVLLPKCELAPRFDYDFTNVSDDGKRYMRGKFEYQRPYWWRRYALKVLGKPDYGGDSLLGPKGIRT